MPPAPLPPLFPHQSAALTRALDRGGSLALFHDPGLGKTRTCLELYQRLRVTTPDLTLLVLCPLSLVNAVWRTEAEAFGLTFAHFPDLDSSADVWALNYERAIRPTMEPRLRERLHRPTLLVCDESSRLKDSRSLTTKTVLTLAPRCMARVVCSGTPTPNGLEEVWAQIAVVDPSRVDRSFYSWRRTWFHLARRGHQVDAPPSSFAMHSLFQSGWRWDITAAKKTALLTRIAPAVDWVKKADALSLPEKVTTIRHVTFSPEEHRAYEQMRRQLVVEFEQEAVTAELALTKLGKLRQLSSGFLYGETTHVLGTSRLTVLFETLEELGNQPVIIWCQFRQEIEQISNVLSERARTLYAETPDVSQSLNDFGTVAQYLIAHPRSAAHGLTLTQCAAAVWYSLDWSLEAYVQANDRIHRIGQTRSCLYVHLIAPGRIDEHIWSVLQHKTSLQAALDAALGGRSTNRHHPSDSPPRPVGVGVPSLGSVAVGHS